MIHPDRRLGLATGGVPDRGQARALWRPQFTQGNGAAPVAEAATADTREPQRLPPPALSLGSAPLRCRGAAR